MTGYDDGWHDRAERYTPDGTVGRLLFGLFVGAPSALVALFSLLVVFAGSAGLAGLVLGPVFALAGIAGTALAVTVLWPVYLSVIGNVERPAAYGVGTEPNETADDPVAVLKRRYAAGEISRAEFERRLDGIVDDPASASDARSEGERTPQTDRAADENRANRTSDEHTDRRERAGE